MKFLCANRIPPDGTPRSVAEATVSGAMLFAYVTYAVWLCPIKRTSGLYELMLQLIVSVSPRF